jgi:hypothetical protein
VIDTPGFDDTGGLSNTRKIIRDIRRKFYSLQTITAIFILMKAHDNRFTCVQRLILDSILSLFTSDMT